MDILKAFVFNNDEHNITILLENDKPFFRASEIGNILDIKCIRSSIVNFDIDEKIIRTTSTFGMLLVA